MKRGAWFQYGSGSKELMLGLAKKGLGSGRGAVFSPRDMLQHTMITASKKLQKLGFDMMIDQQYHIPSYSNKNLQSYEINNHRNRISRLIEINDDGLSSLQRDLSLINEKVRTSAIIAPAVIYETSDDKIVELNEKLFNAAKYVGDCLGIPTYASVIIGRSAISSDSNIKALLSDITRLDADGWYFSFEFSDGKIPSKEQEIYSFLKTGLLLAASDKPIFHAFAGPLGLLSYAFGATAVGIGQEKNLWQFTRNRWIVRDSDDPFIPRRKQPARFFSRPLWGNIIHPDHTKDLHSTFGDKILEHSPYSNQVRIKSDDWSNPSPKQHLLHMLFEEIEEIAALNNARASALHALTKLNTSQSIRQEIANSHIMLKDELFKVQKNWKIALDRILYDMDEQFNYLEFIS